MGKTEVNRVSHSLGHVKMGWQRTNSEFSDLQVTKPI